jgi:16S rRNA processing protein RimM
MIETLVELLKIGTIVSTQGLKGEVRVNPTSDFPERFTKKGWRWLQDKNNENTQKIYLLKGYQIPGKNLFVVKFKGIENCNDAEKLRDCKLFVEKNDLPELPEDEYHVSDLINLEVYHQITGENLGIITNLYVAGNDLLEVKLHKIPAGKKKPVKVLIPFVKAIVPVVNLEVKRIEINPPEGLLELNNESQ